MLVILPIPQPASQWIKHPGVSLIFSEAKPEVFYALCFTEAMDRPDFLEGINMQWVDGGIFQTRFLSLL